jgi:hypothetical protein
MSAPARAHPTVSTATPFESRMRAARQLCKSDNCVLVPVGNDYRRGRHDFKAGQIMVVDFDAVPVPGDFVIVETATGAVFGRHCDVGPLPQAPREQMVMMTLDERDDTYYPIRLGGDGRSFGVVVGVVPEQ